MFLVMYISCNPFVIIGVNRSTQSASWEISNMAEAMIQQNKVSRSYSTI